MNYTNQDLQKLTEIFKQAKQEKHTKNTYSKQSLVKMLIKDIESLKKRGYTIAEISNLFKKGNVDIDLDTLRNYMQRAKKSSNNKKIPSENKNTANSANSLHRHTRENVDSPEINKSKATFEVSSDTADI